MYIYHKYAPYIYNLFVLSYVYGYVFWYTSEELGKWFWGALGKRFSAKFQVYAHWFMSIIISQLKYYSIPVYQDRYATAAMSKYLYTSRIKENSKFDKTALSHNMVVTK